MLDTSSVPTPAELVTWLAVAGVAAARGEVVWEVADDSVEILTGWAGERPVCGCLPFDLPVAFSYGGPARWRVAGPDLLVVQDRDGAVVAQAGTVETGRVLMLAGGPQWLLEPEQPRSLEPTGLGARRYADYGSGEPPMVTGTVQADSVIGRPCWRWEAPDGTRWVDDETGVLLRWDTESHGTVRLTALEIGVPVDESDFDWRAVPGAGPVPRHDDGLLSHWADGLAQTPPFTVSSWPDGAQSYPVEGDPDLPSALVVLQLEDAGSRLLLGVAPAGHPAPVRGDGVHRWSGDGWELALSWTGAPPAELDAVVASVPPGWVRS